MGAGQAGGAGADEAPAVDGRAPEVRSSEEVGARISALLNAAEEAADGIRAGARALLRVAQQRLGLGARGRGSRS